MSEPVTKEYLKEALNEQKEALNEQLEFVVNTVKRGFDRVDERFDAVEGRLGAVEGRLGAVEVRLEHVEADLAYVKERLSNVESEVRMLSATMVTKQYLEAKFDELLVREHKDSLFKRKLLLALEEAHVLTPEARAKLETLIPQ